MQPEQIPNFKNQIPNEFQIPSSKVQNECGCCQRWFRIALQFDPLKIEVWNSFGVWCFVLGIWAVSAQGADPKPLSDGFRQVEKMSQLERDRLQRNLAEFQKLTAEQQAHYRDLHQKLEENKSTGGSLSSLLQEYSAWLTTLTPSQRDDLNKESDPAKKLALVRRFKEQQEYRPEPTPPGPHDEPMVELRNMRRFLPFVGPLLSRSELAAVMQVIAKDAGLDREKPDNESAIKQYRELLKTSIENAPDGPRNWPSSGLQQKIEQAIERQDLRRLLNSRPEMKREMLVRLLLGSVMSLAFDEMRSSLPNESDLQKVLESLERDERDEITRLPRDEANKRLAMIYFKNKGDDTPRKLDEFQRQMRQLFEWLGIPQRPPLPPGGDGPRPRFGPGSFGPGDGRPEGPDGGRPGDRRNQNGDQDRPRRKDEEGPR